MWPRSAWDAVVCFPLCHPLAPDPATITVTPARRIHILDGDGDGRGGGHLSGTGVPGKSEFPPWWGDDRVVDAVERVARCPQTVLALQDNDFWLVQGTVERVTVRVVVTPGGLVWTAYPLRGPGVHRVPPLRSRGGGSSVHRR